MRREISSRRAILGVLFGWMIRDAHAFNTNLQPVNGHSGPKRGDSSSFPPSPKHVPRAEFLASSGSTAFLLLFGLHNNANAAVTLENPTFQAGLDSLSKEAKRIDKGLSKETKKVQKEMKKMDKKITKETKKLEKQVKKEVKTADREIKKDIKKVNREIKKETEIIQQKAQKLGTAVEQKTNTISKKTASQNKRNSGIDLSKVKLCKDPASKCL